MATPTNTQRSVSPDGSMTQPTAALPAGAVADDGVDLVAPAQSLLQGVYLLGSPSEMASADGFDAFIGKTPQSVAVIESGATALSKWWATGLGAAVIAAWGSVVKYWGRYPDQRGTTLIAAAVVSAAALIGIAYVVGSDVRGRSAASVATITARRDITTAVINVARALQAPASTKTPAAAAASSDTLEPRVVSLPAPLPASSLQGQDTTGWLALLARLEGTVVTHYLLVKGRAAEWTPAADVVFVNSQ